MTEFDSDLQNPPKKIRYSTYLYGIKSVLTQSKVFWNSPQLDSVASIAEPFVVVGTEHGRLVQSNLVEASALNQIWGHMQFPASCETFGRLINSTLHLNLQIQPEVLLSQADEQ